ncbi:hypothetical protein K3175_06500 [Qipengyuania sp. GH1]|uniref:hypothetical protein n=1 Tax=Qipengyuania aestuarii TaxID=2867241 RepID=UPI001C86D181|nr:hypothetical protein [Qipengyuania aestuarii]MBX7535306.1 hypothetical protein [Qipengyuania aestuarii]
MTRIYETPSGHEKKPGLNGWRVAGWGTLLALLALPAIAMQLTGEVGWTASDFVFAAILLGALGAGIELAVKVGRNGAHTFALVLTALAAFVTLWANAAVGFVGDGPINMVFGAIIGTFLVLAALARFRPGAMFWLCCGVIAAELATGLAAQFTGQADWLPVLFAAGLWLPPAALFHLSAGRK